MCPYLERSMNKYLNRWTRTDRKLRNKIDKKLLKRNRKLIMVVKRKK